MRNTEVREYLDRQSSAHRAALTQLRSLVFKVAPECSETIRRGVPAYHLDGRPFVSIGATRQHVSLYVMYGQALGDLQDRLAGLDVGKRVVRFQTGQPIPAEIVEEVLAVRVSEIRKGPS